MFFFVFITTATTGIYTYLHPLSLHDALPISFFPTACPSLPRLRFSIGSVSRPIPTNSRDIRPSYRPISRGGTTGNSSGEPKKSPCRYRENSAPTIPPPWCPPRSRSEEHTSELQSLMRNSYAVFCLNKKKTNNNT